MPADHKQISQKMRTAIEVMRKAYAESFRLHEELAECVDSLRGGIEDFAWWTWESTDSTRSDSCLRARLAKYYVPVGAAADATSKQSDDEGQERAHLRPGRSAALLFASIEFYEPSGKVAVPTVFYGSVDRFSGPVVKSELVHLHRGDLTAFLESADLSRVGGHQPVCGRTQSIKARMFLRVFAPLAAMRTGEDVERLAKQLVAVAKDPKALEEASR